MDLNERLQKLQGSAYGKHFSVSELLERLTDEEIEAVFDGIVEGLLQEGRIK